MGCHFLCAQYILRRWREMIALREPLVLFTETQLRKWFALRAPEVQIWIKWFALRAPEVPEQNKINLIVEQNKYLNYYENKMYLKKKNQL